MLHHIELCLLLTDYPRQIKEKEEKRRLFLRNSIIGQ